MLDHTIEELLRKYINFSYGTANHGWNTVYCEVCGDGSRTKGPRGGWLFDDGGNTAFYHCFNCGCNENFALNREHKFSKGMSGVLDSFGIPKREYLALSFAKSNPNTQKKSPVRSVTYLELPDHFVPLHDCATEQAKLVKKYIKTNYGLSTKSFSFYFATGITNSSESKVKVEAKQLAGRLIIPYFKSGKVIYYQARDVTGTSKLKYISPSVPKNNILFNIDQLWRITDAPLYIVEGAMDAIHLSGVSTLGNELTSTQRELLLSSNRKKILVPDFNGDSAKLCHQCIDIGVDIAFPNYRKNAKDVSEAVVRYGKLYVAYDIVNNVKSAMEAKMLLNYMNVS